MTVMHAIILRNVLIGAALFVGSGALILLAIIINYVATGK